MARSMYTERDKRVISALSRELKVARVRAGLTQERLALLAGVNASSISKWEVGGSAMGAYQLIKICHILGVCPDGLISDIAEATIGPEYEVRP